MTLGMLVAAVILVGLLILVLMYNSLIGRRNSVDSVFATVDVQLKKRYDLIPNLVAMVKGYMEHEKDLLEKLTALRVKALESQSHDDKVEIDNQIAKPLQQILLSVENYPDLKANQNMIHLQGTLNEIEEQISAARRAYNASVLEYNNAVDMFPTNLLAGMMRFTRRRFFEMAAAEREPVQITFGSKGD